MLLFRFRWLSLGLFVFGSLVTAYPCDAYYNVTLGTVDVDADQVCDLDTRGPKKKKKPPFPTAAQIEQAILPGQPAKDRAFYWARMVSSFSESVVVQEYAKDWELLDVFNNEIWNKEDFINGGDVGYAGTDQDLKKFTENYSRTFASHTSGKVYLLMPYNTAPPKFGMFWRIEWPALRDSGLVDEIIWLDGDLLTSCSPDPSKVTKTWWKRGQKRPATRP